MRLFILLLIAFVVVGCANPPEGRPVGSSRIAPAASSEATEGGSEAAVACDEMIFANTRSVMESQPHFVMSAPAGLSFWQLSRIAPDRTLFIGGTTRDLTIDDQRWISRGASAVINLEPAAPGATPQTGSYNDYEVADENEPSSVEMIWEAMLSDSPAADAFASADGHCTAAGEFEQIYTWDAEGRLISVIGVDPATDQEYAITVDYETAPVIEAP